MQQRSEGGKMKRICEKESRFSRGAVVYCWTDVPGVEGRQQLDDQERRCRDHCAHSGLEVVACFLDAVERGRKVDRPGLLRMIGFVVRNYARVGRVVVPRFNGFTRSMTEYHLIVALLGRLDMLLESVAGPVEATQDESVSGPLEAFLSACEFERLSALTKQGILAARKKGLATSAMPVGYVSRRTPEGDREIVPDPEVAPIVTEAFRLAASGEMTRAEIVRRLGPAGARLSPRASRLTWKAIRRILSNRTYLGLVHVNEAEGWIKGCFEPLTDWASFEAAQAHLYSDM